MTKPRLKYTEVFPDFQNMAQRTPLEADGKRFTFEGWHHGSIWVGLKGRIYFLQEGDPLISRLRLTR
jgi:hypothetical protein